MKRAINIFSFIALPFVFNSWFTTKEIIGGDWPYFFKETLQGFSPIVPSWSSYHGNGLGGEVLSYSLDSYLYFIVSLFVNGLGVPWQIAAKIFFFGFFLVVSSISIIYLLKTVFSAIKIWQNAIGVFIFTINTYILMIVGGGQVGIALAYSIAPFVLGTFIKLVNSFNLSHRNSKLQIICGLVLAVQVMFDARIAYIAILAVALYAVLGIKNSKKRIFNILHLIIYAFVIPIVIALLLHASWILPFIVSKSSPVKEIINYQSSVNAFKFFSFASFSQSFSLLHPNWPENIFGKTYFLQPEFLVLPILAYLSLLFLSSKFNPSTMFRVKIQSSKSQFKVKNSGNNSTMEQFSNGAIIFFALLGLLGAFLAKGANPPFGEINQWIFQYFPGMNMFRDPTKFYILVTLSYSVLIPFSIISLSSWVNSKFKIQNSKLQFKIQNYLPSLFLLFAICYLLFAIRPALLGQLGGTFKKHEVPKEYIKLKDFIFNQHEFFRTLWIPRQHRFTYYSNFNPSVEGLPLFKVTSLGEVAESLKSMDFEKYLSELSIKYLIVPYDVFGEIFLKDRKYDSQQYKYIIEQLKTVLWLERVEGFGKIAVFKTLHHRERFWLTEGKLSYKMVSPDRYILNIYTISPTTLVFSENYSPYWVIKLDRKNVNAEKTKNGTGINSFSLKRSGNYKVELYNSKLIYYRYGWTISLLTFISLLLFLVIKRNRL